MNLKSLFSFLFTEELKQLESCKEEIEDLRNQINKCNNIENIKKLLIEFPSYEIMRQWLFNNPISERKYISESFDCDDFAYQTQIAALNDGYLMSVEYDPTGYYNGDGQPHMVCSCIIGNMIYIIEPQNDKIIFHSKIDNK